MSQITTFNLIEAAAFLKLNPQILRRKVKAGLIPAAKIGKSWVFIEQDIANFVRSMYMASWQALQVHHKEDSLCHLKNVVKRGGLISPPQAARELDALLVPRIKL